MRFFRSKKYFFASRSTVRSPYIYIEREREKERERKREICVMVLCKAKNLYCFEVRFNIPSSQMVNLSYSIISSYQNLMVY
jgi:hypothetical protein